MTSFGEKYRKTTSVITPTGGTSFGAKYRKDTTIQEVQKKEPIQYQPTPLKPSIKDVLKTIAGKIFGGIYKTTEKFDASRVIEAVASKPLEKITAESKTGKAITTISKETSGIGILARIQSLSPKKTYDEAYKAIKEKAENPKSSTIGKFLYQLGNTVPQTAMGVALSFVPVAGKPLSAAYWAALSASEQIENKGKVSSVTNIAIDTIGDMMLGKSIESLFKSGSKSLLYTMTKNFGIEGGTEVAQDILKYQNNWRMAKTDIEKNAIMEETKKYFSSGQILMTLGVGGVTGALIGGAGQMIGGQPQVSATQQTVNLPQEAPEIKLTEIKPEPLIKPTPEAPKLPLQAISAEKGVIPKVNNLKAGDVLNIDGKNLQFFKKDITADQNITYQFTDNIESGYPTLQLKESQLNTLIKEGRVIQATKEAGVKGIEITREVRKTPQETIDKIEQAEGEIWQELDVAESGQRIMIRTPQEFTGPTEYNFAGQKSSFPDWIPENLRSKKIVEVVGNALTRNERPSPKQKLANELYDIVVDKISEKAGITSKEYLRIISGKEAMHSAIAKSIEARAIEAGLTKGFSNLAEYNATTFKEQAELLTNLMADMNKVDAIVRGEESLPKNIKSSFFVKTVADYYQKQGNAEMLQALVSSPIVSEFSEAGSILSLARENNPYSAFYNIQEVNKVMEKEVKRKVKKPKQQEISEMKESIKKKTEKVSKYSWANLLREIQC